MTRQSQAVRYLALLDEIANEADEIAMRYFRASRLHVDRKPDASPVSEADRSIERMARKLIARRAPDLGVLGEEEGDRGRSDRRLIIDPIDSTRNFIRGIPIFATLLAIELRGQIIAGVVSAPALDVRWRAARGAGAYVGYERMRVSSVKRIDSAQIFHGDLGATAEPPPPPGFVSLLERAERARGFGDFYQHVLVAQGAGEIAIDPVVAPWDIAPLILLVDEAGGRATSFTGRSDIYESTLITSNGIIHDEALSIIND